MRVVCALYTPSPRLSASWLLSSSEIEGKLELPATPRVRPTTTKHGQSRAGVWYQAKHGACMARAWRMQGACMVRAWCVRGACVVRAWHLHGVVHAGLEQCGRLAQLVQLW